MVNEVGGYVFYLRQEGRGIGLYAKLDAYKLQIDEGIDTFEANLRLGFAEDLRDFTCAVDMMKALDIKEIKLLTNNPLKVSSLTGHVKVVEVVHTKTHENPENQNYLKAKVEKHNHRLLLGKF